MTLSQSPPSALSLPDTGEQQTLDSVGAQPQESQSYLLPNFLPCVAPDAAETDCPLHNSNVITTLDPSLRK